MDIDEILERHIFIATDEVGSIDTCYEELIVAIKEIVKETLRMAADDAGICIVQDKKHGEIIVIDKDSIANVYNKIKF
jgi:hypothetical protein